MNKSFAKIQHYFMDANPYKDVNSIAKLVTNHLHLTENHKDIVLLNKPPGFVLSSCLFIYFCCCI